MFYYFKGNAKKPFAKEIMRVCENLPEKL